MASVGCSFRRAMPRPSLGPCASCSPTSHCACDWVRAPGSGPGSFRCDAVRANSWGSCWSEAARRHRPEGRREVAARGNPRGRVFSYMKIELLKYLECPNCRGALSLAGCPENGNEVHEIEEGALNCNRCAAVFPVVRSLPRFVPSDNYASSFGFQ